MNKDEIKSLGLVKGDIIAVMAVDDCPKSSGYSELADIVAGVYLGFFEHVPEVFSAFGQHDVDGYHDAIFISFGANKSSIDSRLEDYESINVGGEKYVFLMDRKAFDFNIYYIKEIKKLGNLNNLLSKKKSGANLVIHNP